MVRAAIFSFFQLVASGVLYSIPRLRLLDYPNHRRINPQP